MRGSGAAGGSAGGTQRRAAVCVRVVSKGVHWGYQRGFTGGVKGGSLGVRSGRAVVPPPSSRAATPPARACARRGARAPSRARPPPARGSARRPTAQPALHGESVGAQRHGGARGCCWLGREGRGGGRARGRTAAASRAPSHQTPPTRETHSPSPSPRGPPLGESPLAAIVRSPRPPSASPSGVRAPLRGGTRGERAAAWPRRGGAAGLPRVSPVATSHARLPGVSCHGNAASGIPPLCAASDTSPPPASACRSGSRSPRGSAGPWTCPTPAPHRARQRRAAAGGSGLESSGPQGLQELS